MEKSSKLNAAAGTCTSTVMRARMCPAFPAIHRRRAGPIGRSPGHNAAQYRTAAYPRAGLGIHFGGDGHGGKLTGTSARACGCQAASAKPWNYICRARFCWRGGSAMASPARSPERGARRMRKPSGGLSCQRSCGCRGACARATVPPKQTDHSFNHDCTVLAIMYSCYHECIHVSYRRRIIILE